MISPTEILTDPSAASVYLRNRHISKVIGQAVLKHHPKRNWIVQPNVEGGVAFLTNADIASDHGMALHLDCTDEELGRKAVMAAGELLERFRLSRDRRAMTDVDLLETDDLGRTIGVKRGYL